jgi:hypothetical protein
MMAAGRNPAAFVGDLLGFGSSSAVVRVSLL